MKKIIIEQCIAIDATPEVFEILADAIVLKAVGYSSPKEYKLSKEPLEFIIKEPVLPAEKETQKAKEEEGTVAPDEDDILLA